MTTTKTTTEKSPKNTSTTLAPKTPPQKVQEKKASGKTEPQNVQIEANKGERWGTEILTIRPRLTTKNPMGVQMRLGGWLLRFPERRREMRVG
jgi:hypothetical protein